MTNKPLKHWLELKLDIDRQTTKQEWQAISRWLRTARNIVERQVSLEGIKDMLMGLTAMGTGIYVQ